MKILGIDPGSLKAGYALIEVTGRKFKYLDSGALIYPKEIDFISRLGLILTSIENVIKVHNPDHISIESLVFVKNISSLAKLAQARGAMLAGLNKTHVGKIFEYSPTLVKSCAAGHGHADKKSVEKSLKMIFGNIEFQSDDESDALAIALTHALEFRNPTKEITKPTLRKKSRAGNSLRSVFKNIK